MLMKHHSRLRVFSLAPPFIIIALALLSACWRSDRITATPTTVATVQPVIAVPPIAPTPSNAPGVVEHRPLTVWIPASFAPGIDATTESDVVAAIEAFSAQSPDAPVEVILKAEDGEASILNYLRTGQQVAPSILPDLLLVDARQLWQIVELRLAQPLTTTQLTHRSDFYPFVWDAVTLDGQLYGVPYFAAPLVLVYNTTKLTTAPATWADLVDSSARFAFPGAGYNGYADDWLLLQYLNAGGNWDSTGAINANAVLKLFQAIEQARASGALSPVTMTYASPSAVWSALMADDAQMGSLPAYIYLGQRSTANPFSVAPLPQLNGSHKTLANVYTFVVLTEEADRKAQALALVDTLLEPKVHSAWARLANWLPTQSAALDAWPTDDAVLAQLRALLEKAVALPGDPSFSESSKRLQLLLNGVMNGELSAEEAAHAYQ
jgi:multiple sugar transport system substrate-binding protein